MAAATGPRGRRELQPGPLQSGPGSRRWRPRCEDPRSESLERPSLLSARRRVDGRAGGRIHHQHRPHAHGVVPVWAGYLAAKAAVLSFTRSLAVDCGDRGVRVNAMWPRCGRDRRQPSSGQQPRVQGLVCGTHSPQSLGPPRRPCGDSDLAGVGRVFLRQRGGDRRQRGPVPQHVTGVAGEARRSRRRRL